MQKTIKQNLNPLFKIHDLVLMDALPRTASKKVIRQVLRDQWCFINRAGGSKKNNNLHSYDRVIVGQARP